MAKRNHTKPEDACPLPPTIPTQLNETWKPNRRKTPSYKQVYIASAAFLILLIPTVLLSANTGIKSELIGEVKNSILVNGHTIIEYSLKTVDNNQNEYEADTLELEGDQRSNFQPGGYYNVTFEKKPFHINPTLIRITEQPPTSIEGIITSVGIQYWSEEQHTFEPHTIVSFNFASSSIELNGNYQDIFERNDYYRITYFGDKLIAAEKSANPWEFFVFNCDLTNYGSSINLMRMAPGDVTVEEINIDGVPCANFTAALVRHGEDAGFEFDAKQTIEGGRIYTVGLMLSSGEVRYFKVEGKNHGSINLFA